MRPNIPVGIYLKNSGLLPKSILGTLLFTGCASNKGIALNTKNASMQQEFQTGVVISSKKVLLDDSDYLTTMGGGALGGALAGAAATSWSGPGAIVGAVVGGVVGATSSLIDSHICTATNKVVGMSEEEIAKMQSLKEYAIENHAGWWNSYFKYGPQLISAITEKENNLSEFYQMIRLVLIEPVSHETDMERCFQIYLGITKMLFMAYMPEFKFGEEA